MQRRMMTDWSAAEILGQGALYVAGRGDDAALPLLTDEMLKSVYEIRRDVFARWAAVSPGNALELLFRRPPLP